MKVFRAIFIAVVGLLPTIAASAQRNGVVTGTITYPAGKFGPAASGFSASNYITIPGSFDTTAQPFTVRVWSQFMGSVAQNAVVLSTTSYGLSMGWDATGRMIVGFRGLTYNGTTPASGTAFHQMDISQTSAGTFLCLDGHAEFQSYNGGGGVGASPSNIGSGSNASGDGTSGSATANPMLGAVDEVTVFSGTAKCTASGSDVQTAAYAGNEQYIVAHYPLDGNANDTVGGTAASLTVSPGTFPLGVVTPFTLTSTTNWAAGTRVTVAGSPDAYASNYVINGKTITGTLWPGTSAGTVSIGDSADSSSASATFTANPVVNVIADGTSLTYGNNDINQGTMNTSKLAAFMASFGPTASGTNVGVSGQTLSDMLGRIGSSFTAACRAGKTNILVAEGGHNDIAQGVDAPTIISRIAAYTAAAKAACPGITILWSTELPAASPQGYPANFDTTRRTANAIIRSSLSALHIDRLADVASDAVIGQDGQEYNSTYYSATDFTHLTPAGYAIWGRYLAGAFTGQIVSSGAPRTGLVY